MDRLTDEQIAAFLEVCEQATAGPWVEDYGKAAKDKPLHKLNADGEKMWTWRGFVKVQFPCDGAFIAASRTLAPALAAETLRLREALRSILYHDERGQGVGFAEAMEQARALLGGER